MRKRILCVTLKCDTHRNLITFNQKDSQSVFIWVSKKFKKSSIYFTCIQMFRFSTEKLKKFLDKKIRQILMRKLTKASQKVWDDLF